MWLVCVHFDTFQHLKDNGFHVQHFAKLNNNQLYKTQANEIETCLFPNGSSFSTLQMRSSSFYMQIETRININAQEISIRKYITESLFLSNIKSEWKSTQKRQRDG